MRGKWLGMMMVMFGLAGLAGANILHGIPGGDATILPDTINCTVDDEYGQPAGYWSSYQGYSTGAWSEVQGEGDDRHLVLWAYYQTDSTSVWYTDYGTTPSDQAWKISADMKRKPHSGESFTGNPMLFDLRDGGSSGDGKFGMSFDGTTINWTAGSQSGSFASTAGLTGDYQAVSFEYDPLTGAAKAMLGSETVFDVTTDTGLAVDTILLNTAATGSWPGDELWVDNITATPEPATMGLLAVGGLGVLLRRRKR